MWMEGTDVPDWIHWVWARGSKWRRRRRAVRDLWRSAATKSCGRPCGAARKSSSRRGPRTTSWNRRAAPPARPGWRRRSRRSKWTPNCTAERSPPETLEPDRHTCSTQTTPSLILISVSKLLIVFPPAMIVTYSFHKRLYYLFLKGQQGMKKGSPRWWERIFVRRTHLTR